MLKPRIFPNAKMSCLYKKNSLEFLSPPDKFVCVPPLQILAWGKISQDPKLFKSLEQRINYEETYGSNGWRKAKELLATYTYFHIPQIGRPIYFSDWIFPLQRTDCPFDFHHLNLNCQYEGIIILPHKFHSIEMIQSFLYFKIGSMAFGYVYIL